MAIVDSLKKIKDVDKDQDRYELEHARRVDPDQSGVMQEALDVYYALEAEGRSPSEAFTEYGFCLTEVLKKAIVEEKRVIEELKDGKTPAEITTLLDVDAIDTKEKAKAKESK